MDNVCQNIFPVKQNESLVPIEGLIPGGSMYKTFSPDKYDLIGFSGGFLVCVDGDKFIWGSPAVSFAEFNVITAQEFHSLVCKFTKTVKESAFPAFRLAKHKPEVYFLDDDKENPQVVVVNFEIKEVRCYSCSGINMSEPYYEYCDVSGLLSYSANNGLYVSDGNDNVLIYKTKDKEFAGVPVSRFEMGVEKGMFWSADGEKLAFYILDNSLVSEYPLVKYVDGKAVVENIFYPKAGETSEFVNVGVYDHNKNKVKVLGFNDDSYKTSISWDLSSRFLYFTYLTRNYKKASVYKCNVGSGVCDEFFTEISDDYLEPSCPFYFFKDGSFVRVSNKDGYNSLYLHNFDGRLLRRLTDQFEVTAVYGFDSNSNKYFFQAACPSPLDRNIFCVDNFGVVSCVTEEFGCHSLVFSDCGYAVDVFTSKEIPLDYSLISLSGDSKQVLKSSGNPFESYFSPKTETGKIRISGDDLYYRLFYPKGFDETKKYPLVFYVYGGPHVQLIRNEWDETSKGFEHLAAQNGFVVFEIDPHGSDGRGHKFESRIYKNIGKSQSEDYIKAMDWLLSEKKFVDKDRCGIYGWSFGGFMTTTMMLKFPEVFKVGVAGGAVINWKHYEVMYTERYMETPEENPDGYAENNLTSFIGSLKGKLMFIHCDNDPVVLWQNTIDIIHEAIKQNVDVDYFVFSGHKHNVIGPDRVYLMKKVINYFKDNL